MEMAPSPLGVTMDDVALRAGVSRATVSRVLTGRVKVAATTRARVLRAINELGYVPNLAASQLAGGESRVVGLLLRDARNPTYGQLHANLQHGAAEEGLQLVAVVPSVAGRADQETSSLQRLLGLRVAGLFVATGVVGSKELVPFLSAVPVISVGRLEDHPQIHAVSYDENAHGTLLADHVYAHGHRRICVLVPQREVSIAENQRGVMIAARLRQRGAEVIELAAHEFGVRGERDDDVVRLVQQRRITAAMFPTDLRAVNFLEIAAKAGLRIPDDVSVTGCDGTLPGQRLIGLASLRVPVETVARRAVQVLSQLLREPGSMPIQHESHRGVIVDGRTLSVPAQ